MPRLLVGDERFVFKKQFFRHCKANSNHTTVRICANKPRLWRGELHWPIGELHLGYPAIRGQACPCVGKGASNFDTKPETVKITKHENRNSPQDTLRWKQYQDSNFKCSKCSLSNTCFCKHRFCIFVICACFDPATPGSDRYPPRAGRFSDFEFNTIDFNCDRAVNLYDYLCLSQTTSNETTGL